MGGETLYGSCIAAVHGCVSRGQELGDDFAWAQLDRFASLAGLSSATIATALAIATSRLWAGSPDSTAADRSIVAAVMIDLASDDPPERDWADWAPPRRLADQCRLVRMIIAWQRGEPLDAMPWKRWRDDALDRMDDPDTERLAAATVRFELGHRPIGAEELERIERLQRYVPARRQPPWTHRQIDPLVAELAQAWRVHGDPRRGNVLLTERIDGAVAAGDDPDTIEACQLAQLRLCRAERSTEYAPVRSLSRAGSPQVRGAAWLVRTLVDGEQPGTPEEAGSWFGWWRCLDTVSLEHPGTAVLVPPAIVTGTAEFADAAEFTATFWKSLKAREAVPWRTSPVFDPEGELRARRYNNASAELTLPPAAFGREAMAAGEVTALRFPGRGISLLRDAARRLSAAGDETGAVRATLLASLTLARRQSLQEAEATWAGIEARHDRGGGWQSRADALEAYLSRRAAPAACRRHRRSGCPPSGERASPSLTAAGFPGGGGWSPLASQPQSPSP